MKAPDKIYINVHPLGVDYSIVTIPDFGGVEYIRKDALVDKLYEWMDKNTTVTDYYSKEDFKKVIDTLF